MKVYLVFRGCYSSRTCRAVFDNKEHARKVAIEQYQIYTQQKLENEEG